jgi:hypothetical protein
MGWTALGLALGGGLILAATFVTDDLPRWLTVGALLAWLLALVLFVVLAVREARSEGRSFGQTSVAGLKAVGRFFREFMP